uniref:Cyclin-like domain-containing protein n=1 Tax=Panagrolaimus superbus TaxID=310955 RepID=A0A914Z1A8_9BILA
MKLKEQQTLYTACTFFHRFYMVQSFKEHPLEIAALGCLFLAGKVEETPKKCRDIVNVAKEVLRDKYSSPTLLQDVFQFERTLLSTLGFDLNLDNPYTFLELLYVFSMNQK